MVTVKLEKLEAYPNNVGAVRRGDEIKRDFVFLRKLEGLRGYIRVSCIVDDSTKSMENSKTELA